MKGRQKKRKQGREGEREREAARQDGKKERNHWALNFPSKTPLCIKGSTSGYFLLAA